MRNQTSWNSPTMWRWIFHKKSETLPSDGSRTRLPRRRISAIGNSDFTEGGGGEPSETEVVADHRGSAMRQRVAGRWFTADSRGGIVEEVRAATSTTGGQQMGQHGDKAEDGAA
jgi:hypothetical protein